MDYNVKNGALMLYYAVETAEATKTTPATYGEVKPLGEIISVSLSTETNSTSLYAGNREVIKLEDPEKLNLTITLPDIASDEDRATLFGYALTEEGGMIKDQSKKKKVALMMEQTSISSATKEEVIDYITIFNCDCTEGDLNLSTKTESQEFQNYQFTATATAPANLDSAKYIISSDSADFDKDGTFLTEVWGKTVPTVTKKA